MKLLPILLGVSLAANAALIVVNRSGASATSAKADEISRGTAGSGATTEAIVKRSGPATGEGAAIASALNDGDAEALRDELRAAGVDEDLIRSIVGARIWKRYEARMKTLQAGTNAKHKWWKNDEDFYWGGQTKEQRAEMRALQAEVKAESERVLGKEATAEMRSNPWMERQYGYISPEKRDLFQQLEQDYNELSNDLRRESRGFQMPADAEKARFLQDEKRRDLAEFLSPEELADYDRRQSRTAQNLRWQMTQMDASEEEYVAIFEIRKEFDEQYADYDNFGNRLRMNDSPEQKKARGEAEQAMKAQIKETLGPERYQAYVRSNDRDYQQLMNATKRFELPADTPAKVFNLRDEVPQAALKIADDANLTPDQKKAELKKLAEDARDRVKGMLGADVAQVYFDNNNGMQWLRQLENGTIITFDENGGQQHRRVDQPVKPPAPPKAK